MSKRNSLLKTSTTTLKRFVSAAVLFLAWFGLPMEETAQAKGGWGLGIGYQNPVPSDLGVSLLYLGDSWAFEAALGGIGLWSNDNSTGASLGGDVDFKWVLGSDIKAYLQAGLQFGIGASDDGAGLGLGGPFAGAGVLLTGSRVYGMIGGDYVFNTSRAQLTATLGLFL